VAGAARFVWLMSAAATVLYAPVLAVSLTISPPQLTARSWLFLIGTGILQAGYFLFLQWSYRAGDLSAVYPIGRGSVWDKVAVTTVGNPPLLQGYASVLGMAVMLAPAALADRARLRQTWHRYRRQAVGAGLLSPLAYILVLIAMTFTSVAAVAPAREVSVLFGVVLGRRLLGEGGLARRLAGGAAIVIGVIAVAVG